MNRRGFVLASAAAALSMLADGIGRNDAVARKRGRNRGGSAFARAAVTGTGGRVSVAVNCGSGRSSSQSSQPPGSHGQADGQDVSARC